MSEYRGGDMGVAVSTMDRCIAKSVGGKDPLRCHDSPWMFLDRATLRWVQGDLEGAIDDYRTALRALDYFDQESDSEQAVEIALGEMSGAYMAPPFEHVLARCYLALTLFELGDEHNAYALLRQAEEWQQQRRAELRGSLGDGTELLVENPFSKWLFATALEKRGDYSNAAILRQDVQRLLQRHELPFTVLSDNPPYHRPDAATVVVICHNGSVPFRVSETCPESLWASAAVELALTAEGLDPAASVYTGFEVPQLERRVASRPIYVRACVGEQTKVLSPCFDVDAAAESQLAYELPGLIAKATLRHALRRGAVAATRRADSSVGAVADFAVLMWNLSTHADTRSWVSLPCQIDVARFDLPPGRHRIELEAQGCGQLPGATLDLPANAFSIIHIFSLQPGRTIVRYPKHHVLISETSNEKSSH